MSLHATDAMAARKTLDRQRGPLPVIRTDGDGVTLLLKIAGLPTCYPLVIRCDSDGNIWAAIPESDPDSEAFDSR